MPNSINNEPEPWDQVSPVSIETLKEIQKLFQLGDLKQIAAALSDPKFNRPKTWSGLTVAPYYKERFALEFKATLDEMMKEYGDGNVMDREWRYEDFPQYSNSTMYNKINQSKMYLLDHLDHEGVYRAFLQLLSINRKRTGVRLSYNQDIKNPSNENFRPSPVLPKAKVPLWIKKMDEWLETAQEGEKFVRKNLSLTDEEISKMTAELSNIEGLLVSIESTEIKLVKIPLEQWKKINS